jgi:ABC-2 type transport system permease protein
MSAEANGIIHDIGYQRYGGPRLGRTYAVRSLYAHAVRTAFGLGRGAKAKVFPWIVVGLMTLVAVVAVVLNANFPEGAMTYWDLPQGTSLLLVLFCAVVAPELVSRDLRGGVLPLYFSRPLTRSDYALGKLAGLVTAMWLAVAGPQFIMFLGGAFSVDRFADVWPELGDFGKGLGATAAYAVVFGALSLLIASLAGRRAVAAAMIVAAFLITTPVYGVLLALAEDENPKLEQLAGLVSPMTLVDGLVQWWVTPAAEFAGYGPAYAFTAVGLVAVCVSLLLLRYRKVAQ